MNIIITPEAEKQYNQLTSPEQKKIKKKLQLLATNPYAGKKLSGKLSYLRSLKAWPYRIVYYTDEKKKIIFIITIAHRQGIYK